MILDKLFNVIFLIPAVLMGIVIVIIMLTCVIGTIAGICGNNSVLEFGAKHFHVDVPAFNAMNVSFFLFAMSGFMCLFGWLSSNIVENFYSIFSACCVWYLVYSIDVWYNNFLEYMNSKDARKLLKEKK